MIFAEFAAAQVRKHFEELAQVQFHSNVQNNTPNKISNGSHGLVVMGGD